MFGGQIREIRKIDLFFYFILPLFIIPGLWISYALAIYPNLGYYRFIFLAVFILATYYFFRNFLIGLVLVYKAFAPMEMRHRCRFTPTCSTYMIMSIQKYGIIYGVFKGLKRIRRCVPPNGGVDYP